MKVQKLKIFGLWVYRKTRFFV